MAVARQVVAALKGRGYTVDLLEEWDLRLENYQAAAFISIHADECTNFNDGYNHSGFKSSYPIERFTVRARDEQLNDCIRENYGRVTGLPFTPGSITEAMTKYHAFHESQGHPGIALTTPGIILELGILSYDRDLLQNGTDKMTQGVFNGLLCFLDPQSLATSQAGLTPPPNNGVVTPTATRAP
jgi:N-acetylmuramoyl-L-alanine amidase